MAKFHETKNKKVLVYAHCRYFGDIFGRCGQEGTAKKPTEPTDLGLASAWWHSIVVSSTAFFVL